ncbi:MAG: MATE family efflux transporter, partial [Clostridiales bacterium]|nr:MATE family efflux transporter [Clostridiales bacterium]
ILKSYFVCLLYSFGIGAIMGGVLLLCGRYFLAIFTTEQAVIDAGMKRLTIMGFSYAVSAFMDCAIAASRGLGKTIIPTVIVIMGSCVFRIIWVYTIFAYFKTIPSLYLLYIFSWTITAAAETIYFAVIYKRTTRGKPKEPTPAPADT